MIRWSHPATLATLAIAVSGAAFAVLAINRAWICDDGLIVVRTASQILAGNGPVYSTLERVEPNTSTLWTWLVALVGALTRGDLAITAVVIGGILAVAGVVVAMDGARRMHVARGSTAIVVPAGVLVVLGSFAFWDFATSGLETGLSMAWIATIWWLLVTLRPEATLRRQIVVAVVFGLGPLVRPDFAITSLVFVAAAWTVVRPRWRRALVLAAFAGALPVGYEIFRAGFYGALVPMPALAKSAATARWDHGLAYLENFADTYALWWPSALLAAVFAAALRHRAIARRALVLIAAPVISGVASAVYVTRVGGDFMHGRLLVPATFMILLPAMMIPLRRFSAPAVTAIAVWAAWIGIRTSGYPDSVVVPLDQRRGYVEYTRTRNPIDADVYTVTTPTAAIARDAIRDRRRILLTESAIVLPLDPALDAPIAVVAGRLGLGGAIAPLDGVVVDILGLANPIGARISMTYPDDMPGHQKVLPFAWVLADVGDPAFDDTPIGGGRYAPPAAIRAARRAMVCGELAELLAAVRAPLTASRFWSNLTGSLRRTRLAIPADPVAAEHAFCGARARIPLVTVSSAADRTGWAPINAVDGVRDSLPATLGFTTAPRAGDTAWIEVKLASPRPVSSVVLYPRDDPDNLGEGFPVAFAIEIWDGTTWHLRATRDDYPKPSDDAGEVFAWDRADITDRIRIRATELRSVGHDGRLLQLAEIEIP